MRATLAVVLRASTMMRRKARVSDRRTCRRPVRGDGRAGGTGDRAVKHPDDRATRIWCTGRDLHLFTKTGMVSTLAEQRSASSFSIGSPSAPSCAPTGGKTLVNALVAGCRTTRKAKA
jgi:hypothetical protein